jgi:hypothetical protein
MLDARHIYRKVTRKIYDFSPEQQANLAAIVWLYRGAASVSSNWSAAHQLRDQGRPYLFSRRNRRQARRAPD